MPRTDSQPVLAANEAFYAAMRAGDLAAMDALWTRARPVSCTHPGQAAIFGRAAVMASWRLILESFAAPDIHPVDAHAIVSGGSALILCGERIGDVALMASNSFVREDGVWRMVSHHAARVTPAGRR